MKRKGLRISYYLPVKLIAALLCVLSVLSACLFTAAAILNDQMEAGKQTEEEYSKIMEQKITQNYSAWILDMINHGDELPAFDGANFHYAVVKSDTESLEGVDLTDPANYEAGDPKEAKLYEYTYSGVDKASYWYHTDEKLAYDLWGSWPSYYYENDSRFYSEISQFVYAYDQGVFYFRTPEGDYPARNICIADQTRLELDDYGNYIDEGRYEEIKVVDEGIGYGINYTRYHLEKLHGPSGNTVLRYISEEEGLPLELSQCESWREVGFYSDDWNWCAGFDVRFVRKDSKPSGTAAAETASGTQLEIEGVESDAAGGGNYFVDGDEEEQEFTEEPEELPAETEGEDAYDGTDMEPEEEPQNSVLVTAPREMTLKPISLAQLKPVDPETEDYSIYGKSSIWITNPENDHTYYFVLSHVEESKTTDTENLFALAARNVHYYYVLTRHTIFFEVLSVLLFIICFTVFCLGVGHRSDSDEIVLTWLDRVPFEIVTFAAFCLIGLAIGGCVLAGEEGQSISLIVSVSLQMVIAGGLIGLLYLATFLVRLKGRCFWRHTLLHWCVRPFIALGRMARENIALFWQCVLLAVAALAVDFLIVGIGGRDASGVLFCFRIVHSLLFVWIAMQLSRLQKGTGRIVGGDYSQKIDTRHLVGPFRRHAEDINHIGDGLEEAVREQLKSEHLRTELITNVSHDIKTPLTSIINYVDLMQKLNLEDAQAKEYLEVLDRQSSRLKKLIEDLMEASKASTGNIDVNMEITDVGVLLEQAAGEFGEKLDAKGLQLLIQTPEESVKILADGRYLWRVFENLLGNICKYSMPQTRVYVQLNKTPQEAMITFRNISAYALNISPEELMERFVRGDSSRHTEGSGLGLAIAQSLTILMGGKMKLDIDGDLFKVTLQFPLE